MECTVTLEADILAAFPAEVRIPARLVADAVAASNAETPRMLIVLDDDPTGTQSVADLPVLTRWEVKDFTWASIKFGNSIKGFLYLEKYFFGRFASLCIFYFGFKNKEKSQKKTQKNAFFQLFI